MKYKKVAVLLSTYNGEKYVKEQLDSILTQTYSNIEIYIRDDGSSDKTIDILKDYEKEGKIHLILGKNLGFINSFFELLKYCEDADYYAFSDQDDVWLEDKIERAVKILEKNENIKNPIMYYSNYDFYNADMSFKSHPINRKNTSFQNCLVECANAGMATIINKKARDIVLGAIPQYCSGHDWWIYMICQGLGKVIYDDVVMVKHRSHGNNTSECGKSFIGLQIFRIKSLFKENYFKTIHKQIQEYAKYFYNDLTAENQEIIKLFNIKKFQYRNQLKKVFYAKRFRDTLSDEIIIRFMFLIGVI